MRRRCNSRARQAGDAVEEARCAQSEEEDQEQQSWPGNSDVVLMLKLLKPCAGKVDECKIVHVEVDCAPRLMQSQWKEQGAAPKLPHDLQVGQHDQTAHSEGTHGRTPLLVRLPRCAVEQDCSGGGSQEEEEEGDPLAHQEPAARHAHIALERRAVVATWAGGAERANSAATARAWVTAGTPALGGTLEDGERLLSGGPVARKELRVVTSAQGRPAFVLVPVPGHVTPDLAIHSHLALQAAVRGVRGIGVLITHAVER
mmetsp:Transcript_27451/g.60054  ORF Transcript_27451/g.60054 Transcript_27451/m.60054 type:complete len:258 (-) Transcript_27451:2815-3588(-)